jgi:hypothetical protein
MSALLTASNPRLSRRDSELNVAMTSTLMMSQQTTKKRAETLSRALVQRHDLDRIPNQR